MPETTVSAPSASQVQREAARDKDATVSAIAGFMAARQDPPRERRHRGKDPRVPRETERGVPRDTRDTVRRGANTHLLDVEDEIEFAHILEALVERLDEDLDQVEDPEVALELVHREDKV